MGRDEYQKSKGILTAWFQFTRPHGARQDSLKDVAVKLMFQFTRPHGARLIPGMVGAGANMFQFTRPHGARRPAPGSKRP